jgi:hypothetical protein
MAQTGDNETPLLNDWRQGDLALLPVELPFLEILDGELVASAAEADFGVAILTQSCDIVRSIDHKPHVQVAALVKVDVAELDRAKAGHLPGRIYLQALQADSLVIDLDSAATVHKEVVATWPRTPGCPTDEEQRRFGAALARHRQRFAFPDSFNALVKPIRRWFERKAGKDNAAGKLVDHTHEVRVRTDSWDAPTELVFLVLLREPATTAELKDWHTLLDDLASKAKGPGWPLPEFRIATLRDISAAEYLASDRLDWDGLSNA